jgi:streptogramin lyase
MNTIFRKKPSARVVLASAISSSLILYAAWPGVQPAWATPAGLPALFTADADFAQGSLVNVNYTAVADQLQLDDKREPFNFVWVAVSTKGTVVKIDANTGDILGEYFSAPDGRGRDPSRTTVDSKGNVWVANRAESGAVLAGEIEKDADGNPVVPLVDRFMGSVTYIGLKENGQCIDRNGNGTIETSTAQNDIKPWTNAGGANTLGGVSTAEDECIIHYTRVNSYGTRHVAVNADNNVWVGGTGGRYFDLIDDATGKIIRQAGTVGWGGYGGLIDSAGVIWSTGSGHLFRWDTALDLTGLNGDPAGNDIGPPIEERKWAGQSLSGAEYGLCLNRDTGEVWNTTYGVGRIYRYTSAGKYIDVYPQGYTFAQGCVVDRKGDVWVAHSLNGNTVGHLDSEGNYKGTVAVGSGPTGVAVDGNGKIWATNYYSGTVSRIDPMLSGGVGEVDFTTVGLGGNPYNYSDMTGSTLTAPPDTGTWTVKHDTLKPGLAKVKISWNGATPGDSSLAVKIACSSDNVTFGAEQPVSNGEPAVVDNCQYVQVNVAFQRSTTTDADKNGVKDSPILYDLTISSNEPPVCTGAYPSVNLLWPANHQFVPVQVLGVTDPDGDSIAITIKSIFQDEPVDTFGDGKFTPDGKGVGTAVAELRAERVGTPKVPGDGRVYHIGFTADDGNGGTCSGSVKVGVPHDQGKRIVPVDGGPLYDSILP